MRSRSARHRRVARPLLVVLAFFTTLLGVWLPSASASVVHYVYRTCTTPGGCGMYLRSAPALGASHIGLMYDGNAFTVNCWTLGDSVYGDPVWLQGVWNGQSGYAMDYYIDTHWNTTQDLTNQGIPRCGSTPPPPPPPPAGSAPAVWVGSPIDAAWPNAAGCSGAVFPSSSCSLPSVHHYSTGANNADWAADLQARPGQNIVGQPVYLYAAPQNTSVAIRAQIEAINSPCRSGAIADGGYQVIVGFYSGATRIGSATYAHINLRSGLAVGQQINRWGTVLGTVGSFRYSSTNTCWSGPHLHVQMYSAVHYACYNRGWAPAQYVARTNFIGFTGGNFAGAPRQPCP